MKFLQATARVIAAVTLVGTALADGVDPLIIKGSKFFYKTNGTQFFMKGVAYQQGSGGNGSSTSDTNYTDPLADEAACRRDVPVLRDLHTNTIRVYAIDPSKDHSQCMRMLQEAGIYVISDLSEPKLSINRDVPSWNEQLYARYTSVIDELSKYNNVIGFFAGNEVTNAVNNTQSTPFVKAAVRDMKAYIKKRNYRPMGVGYATNDDADIRQNLADYFSCGNRNESIDFWGYNIYSWCGSSDYRTSGYADRTKAFAEYPVPVFFAEYGCNQPKPRKFEDVQALYGKDMSPVWSGGIVYMYFQEENQYGLVSVSGSSVSKLADYTSLSSQLAKVTPSATKANDYSPTNTNARSCPPTGSGWNASSTLPPTPNRDLCGCVVKNLTCTAKPNLSDDTVAKLFGTVCGLNKTACVGVARDGSQGTYGAVSGCSPSEQLSWAFNAYYFSQAPANRASACNFDGNAQMQQPSSPSGSCKDLIVQVGAAGTGSVTSTPTIAGGGSSPSSTTTKKSTAGAVHVGHLDVGLIQLGAYLLAALFTGAGMIML